MCLIGPKLCRRGKKPGKNSLYLRKTAHPQLCKEMMQRDRIGFDALCPNQGEHVMGLRETLVPMVPRSSSPVTVYVELPCIVEEAFPTIAWEDFEDCPSGLMCDTSSSGNRASDCNSEDHDLQDCALDLIDSPCPLESSLSSVEIPFQGCIIPPLTPQPDVSAEDGGLPYNDHSNPPVQYKADWKDTAHLHGCVLGHSVEVHPQLHRSLEESQEEIQGYGERNHHLKQLASRAKHLAEVLEKLMTVSEPRVRDTVMAPDDQPSLSPCKRQRLDEGYETETDTVEDMLRDISTRCNAVLHTAASTAPKQAEADSIHMFGSFSGLQTSFSNCRVKTDRLEEGEKNLSLRASVREHSTIKTQVFAHGHAFTTRTRQGGYGFRWVPNQS